jgi:hypothetical protein
MAKALGRMKSPEELSRSVRTAWAMLTGGGGGGDDSGMEVLA